MDRAPTSIVAGVVQAVQEGVQAVPEGSTQGR